MAHPRFGCMRRGLPRHAALLLQIPGKKLVDAFKEQLTAFAQSQGMTLEELRRTMAERPTVGADGTAPPVMHMPSPWVMQALEWYSSARTYAYNAGVLLYNATVGVVRGYASYADPSPTLNPDRILTTLAHINGHTVLVRESAVCRAV